MIILIARGIGATGALRTSPGRTYVVREVRGNCGPGDRHGRTALAQRADGARGGSAATRPGDGLPADGPEAGGGTAPPEGAAAGRGGRSDRPQSAGRRWAALPRPQQAPRTATRPAGGTMNHN